MELTSRELLTHLYQTAVDSVDGRFSVHRWCTENRAYQPDHVVAIGKAAPAMLQGAFDVHQQIESALLVCPERRLDRKQSRDDRIDVRFSSHPVPDERSLEAGRDLLGFISRLPEESRLLFLISGGTSSLVEVLEESIDLETIRAVNRHLLASGYSIEMMNRWRRQFSRIKGGGLIRHIGERDCKQLLISDVRHDDPAVIGSGLLVDDAAMPSEDSYLQSLRPGTTVDVCERVIDSHIVATLTDARKAAFSEAEGQGVDAHLHEEFVAGDAVDRGREIAAYLRDAPVGVHVFGGETTVTLPDDPGIGGRNQSLALAMSEGISGQDICVLCAGTDGIDGPTPCAGAVVTGDTATQAGRMGLDIQHELDRANAGTVLMATGDLFKPGPTGTNVMDLIIAYKRS